MNVDIQTAVNGNTARPEQNVTVAGGQVFFGSSVDDAVHALDAATGVEQWVFFTGAPVRFPPCSPAGEKVSVLESIQANEFVRNIRFY